MVSQPWSTSSIKEDARRSGVTGDFKYSETNFFAGFPPPYCKHSMRNLSP